MTRILFRASYMYLDISSSRSLIPNPALRRNSRSISSAYFLISMRRIWSSTLPTRPLRASSSPTPTSGLSSFVVGVFRSPSRTDLFRVLTLDLIESYSLFSSSGLDVFSVFSFFSVLPKISMSNFSSKSALVSVSLLRRISSSRLVLLRKR